MYKKLDVGFTGTRHGMTPAQAHAVAHLLGDWAYKYRGYDYFLHHGCCKGADRQAHDMARALGFKITAHPGPRNSWDDFDSIPFSELFIVKDRKNFHPRNDDIVEESEIVLATPQSKELNVQQRGGTWYTVRRAISRGKSLYVILTGGEVHKYYNGSLIGRVIIGADSA